MSTDGGAAFPVSRWINTDGNLHPVQDNGMSLRDYFATAALSGLLSDPEERYRWEQFANKAYAIADAMLAERDK